nr:MAG: major capsid protein [Microvirus sp.]
MSNVFRKIGGLRPGRSAFDLSYDKKFTADMGQLIPVMCDEVIPGDIFDISAQAVVRFQPLVAPILHEINLFAHYFFVPYRLLWEGWELFITGGPDGDDASVLPRWNPSEVAENAEGSLWDYLGFPVGVDPAGAYPLDFPRRAYNMIYNEYYRDENLQEPVDLDNWQILNRNWMKDYFTSALPWQQRGVAPALPIAGYTYADFTNAVGVEGSSHYVSVRTDSDLLATQTGQYNADVLAALNKNQVDLSEATSFDVSDLRLAFQIQKWLERNARTGVRYKEFLQAHFGVTVPDERLQRPEYIGGTKAPIITSEVLQTSSTDSTSPQGNLAGHGIGVAQGKVGRYRVTEFGLIMGIMSVMPVPSYQQGIDRQWLRETRYDFTFPEFANLSEQAITRAEIFASNVEAENTALWGYQGRYDELRVKRNMICGGMRSTFNYWHLGRIFANAPALNEEFVECIPDKRIFAVQNEPGLIVQYANLIRALRPIPIMSAPGLIDHN